MFLKERHAAIVNLVNADGRVTVTDLAERFDVTEDCIRKDLRQLDAQGLLQRVYGGAVSMPEAPETDVRNRLGTRMNEKRLIGQKALGEISDGEVLYLDVSTTNIALAELIAQSGKRVTVISNMMEILRALSAAPNVTAIATGGIVDAHFDGFIGSVALKMLEPLVFDRVFIGALAVDLSEGWALSVNADDAAIKDVVMSHTKTSYLMVDQRKFRTTGSYRYARLGSFDFVVSDEVPEDTKREIESWGCVCL